MIPLALMEERRRLREGSSGPPWAVETLESQDRAEEGVVLEGYCPLAQALSRISLRRRTAELD